MKSLIVWVITLCALPALVGAQEVREVAEVAEVAEVNVYRDCVIDWTVYYELLEESIGDTVDAAIAACENTLIDVVDYYAPTDEPQGLRSARAAEYRELFRGQTIKLLMDSRAREEGLFPPPR